MITQRALGILNLVGLLNEATLMRISQAAAENPPQAPEMARAVELAKSIDKSIQELDKIQARGGELLSFSLRRALDAQELGLASHSEHQGKQSVQSQGSTPPSCQMASSGLECHRSSSDGAIQPAALQTSLHSHSSQDPSSHQSGPSCSHGVPQSSSSSSLSSGLTSSGFDEAGNMSAGGEV